MTTNPGYPAVSAIDDEELDEVVSEEPPTQQPRPDAPTEPTLDALIEAAEKSGDWLQAGKLKVEKARQLAEGALATVPTPEPTQQPPGGSEGETEENLRAQISDAEANADYFQSGLAKAKLVNKRAEANPLNPDVGAPLPSSDEDQDLELRIHDAESRGDWAESLRLKSLRAGVTP